MPEAPVLAVSVALFRHRRVLLARRGRPPAENRFSLPGGRVEAGERLAEAAARELAEETGLALAGPVFSHLHEVIGREPDGTLLHAVIAVFAAHWAGGEPRPGPEATAFAWASPAEIEAWPEPSELTDGLAAAVRRAEAIFDSPAS